MYRDVRMHTISPDRLDNVLTRLQRVAIIGDTL